MSEQKQQKPFPSTIRDGKPCWIELLIGAVSGIYPSEQQLEKMLEYLEGTP